MSTLHGKTLIVTGASHGIGKALAVQLAESGVNLVLNARTPEALKDTCSKCEAHGVACHYVPGDASNDDTAFRLVARALESGNFFGFIHAAGVLKPGPSIWELSENDFQEVFAASAMAAHQLIRYAVPPLLRQKEGVAVFFGSGAADRAQPGIAAYCAAKAAEEGLARNLAAETDAVTTITYRPGIVDTRMQAQARESEGGSAEALQRVFRPWKEEGKLISAEESAKGLMRILEGDLRDNHGKTLDVREL